MTDPLRIAAANCPQHTGTAALVRDALKRERRPLSIYQISLVAGIKYERVKKAISGMLVGSTGVIYRVKGANGVTYYTTERPDERPREVRLRRGAGSGQIAGRITHGRGSRWGAGLV